MNISVPATLWAIGGLLVSLVYRILDAVGVVPTFTADFVLEIIADILTLLGLFGVIVDPTTEGVQDSNRAMGYDQPWSDENDYSP